MSCYRSTGLSKDSKHIPTSLDPQSQIHPPSAQPPFDTKFSAPLRISLRMTFATISVKKPKAVILSSEQRERYRRTSLSTAPEKHPQPPSLKKLKAVILSSERSERYRRTGLSKASNIYSHRSQLKNQNPSP